MTVTERHCTMTVRNDQGSTRMMDIVTPNTNMELNLHYHANSGSLSIGKGDDTQELTPYQVQVLVQFLQQKD